ncbi:MAG: hypothetical protein Q4P65_01650 [Eubacteriales bacterium]|nr:hypothetical protein [Eubacteriales bacterium]
MQVAELEEIIRGAGFEKIFINLSEVTDEYAAKWGYGQNLKNYIGKALIQIQK